MDQEFANSIHERGLSNYKSNRCTNKKMKIVVVGSLNMDLVVQIPVIPRSGETLLGGVFKTFPGGKGANQAVAAARLGADVIMVGCVGGDAFGKKCEYTGKRGLILPCSVHSQEATGVALIQVDQSSK